MQERSRRNSLWEFLCCGRRCISSTTLTALFMDNPSIKLSSRLIVPQRKFTSNIYLLMYEVNNSARSLLSSYEGQKISFLWIFNSRHNLGPIYRMMSRDLATPYKSYMMVSSLRHHAWRRSLHLSLTWWISGCNTRTKRSGPNGSLYCTPATGITWSSSRYNLAAWP